MAGKDQLDIKVDAMELEMLNPSPSSSGMTVPSFSHKSWHSHWVLLQRRLERIWGLVRLYYQMHPQRVLVAGGLITLLLVRSAVKDARSKTLWTPPHLVNHFGDLQSYYDLQISKIDHW